jgi:hypothetical protein
MSSVDNIAEAKELYEGVKSIYSSCSMKLHKIANNSQELLSSIPDVEKAKGFHTDDFLTGSSPTTTTLGLLWSRASDSYSFRVMEVPNNVDTMRGFLKYTATLFDPLGFLAPYIVVARLIVQTCCKLKLSWDEKVPADVLEEWKTWTAQLPALSSFKLPRALRRGTDDVVLHAFCDASGKAYAICLYAVTLQSSVLVYAKAKKLRQARSCLFPGLSFAPPSWLLKRHAWSQQH